MLIAQLSSVLTIHWPWLLPILFILYHLKNKYGNGINQYPGPVLASFSNWWRFFDAWGRRAQHTQIALHRRHGDIVRIGPNVLSFASPQCIKDIYGLNKGFTKTEFYLVQNNISHGERIYSLFSTLDEKYHAQLRRNVNSAFAMSTLVSYEPLVDETASVFLKESERRFAQSGKVFDFAQWLQYFAFDVIGQMSFSKRLGFIEKYEDVDGIIEAIADTLAYAGPVGQQPWLDRYFLQKNPIKLFLMKRGLISSDNPVAAFASKRSRERRADIETLKRSAAGSEDIQDSVKGVDFLTRLMIAQKSNPEFMNDHRLLTVVTSLINAGSDTTAISLSSVFYHLLKNPRIYSRLMQEIADAESSGQISPSEEGLVSWSNAQKMPYLDAVIQESFRIFPAAGLLLERHVPPGGAKICGQWIPGGTIVGANAWVLHRRPEIFGQDVDSFRPERWLEANPTQLKEMKATMFQFGAGSRTCIGRNISTLEIYKLVPTFLRKFKVSHHSGKSPNVILIADRLIWLTRKKSGELKIVGLYDNWTLM